MVRLGALRSRVVTEALQTDVREVILSRLLGSGLCNVAIANGLVIRHSPLLALAVSVDLALAILPLACLSSISRGATAIVARLSVYGVMKCLSFTVGSFQAVSSACLKGIALWDINL